MTIPYKPRTEIEVIIINDYMSQGMSRKQAEYKLDNPNFIIRMLAGICSFAFICGGVIGFFYLVYGTPLP
jgi:hypothetical protein